MPDRLRLAIVFGGQSVEHEVSVVSAQHVIAAADPELYDVMSIGVTKDGVWLSPEETQQNLARTDPPFKKTMVAQGEGPGGFKPRGALSLHDADVVFPLIHGLHGEDGSIQGLLEILGLPYVGCGVAASAIGMDKALTKSICRAEGIPVADYVVLSAADATSDPITAARDLEARIGYPAFVKPANGGSSIGITKAYDRETLAVALTEAAKHDRKIIVEKQVVGREVECAILGNDHPEASPVGEIVYSRDFYDFEAKYLDNSTQVIAPADLPPEDVARIQALAIRAFRAIDGSGMARVDFFLSPDGSLTFTEINTLPGFTPVSMFPRLWDAVGVNYTKLITRLVELAISRHREMRIV